VTLASLLLEHPFADDEPLLHSVEETMTAGAARSASDAIAAHLREQGVQPRQAVCVQMSDGPAAITTMFGIWVANAVFVPVHERAPAPEVERIVAVSRPALLIRGQDWQPRDGAATHDDGVAFATWTSGTTGTPKPIWHTHDDYLELLDRVLGPLQAKRATGGAPMPNLVPVSLALNAGIYNVLFGLRAGAGVVVMPRFESRSFAALVRRFAIRSTVLPPAALTMLADDTEVTDLAPLRYVRSITAPLSPMQARRFADKFGVVVLNGYGQAELGEVIGWSADDARSHPDKLGAAGRAHANVAIKIADADAEGVGRLLVRPPSTAVGIEPARIDAEGYVDTGDLARIDRDGFVWIEGRAGDVVNRGGNKVFPDQVEEVLRLAPTVIDAAVVGAPDERLGEVPVAFVVATCELRADELTALCREHLAPYKVPVSFVRVEALPRNDVGKLLRRELLTRLPRR
jgi:acyl-coenzyme A synthetase/AMP-(fatty) acid ligase